MEFLKGFFMTSYLILYIRSTLYKTLRRVYDVEREEYNRLKYNIYI